MSCVSIHSQGSFPPGVGKGTLRSPSLATPLVSVPENCFSGLGGTVDTPCCGCFVRASSGCLVMAMVGMEPSWRVGGTGTSRLSDKSTQLKF